MYAASLRRMSSPVWNRVYTLDVGEVSCDSYSVKTSVALGLADLLPLSHPFLVLPSPRKRMLLCWPEAEEVEMEFEVQV
jgi:hypothetical protein